MFAGPLAARVEVGGIADRRGSATGVAWSSRWVTCASKEREGGRKFGLHLLVATQRPGKVPMFAQIGSRMTPEGDGDVPTTWTTAI